MAIVEMAGMKADQKARSSSHCPEKSHGMYSLLSQDRASPKQVTPASNDSPIAQISCNSIVVHQTIEYYAAIKNHIVEK